MIEPKLALTRLSLAAAALAMPALCQAAWNFSGCTQNAAQSGQAGNSWNCNSNSGDGSATASAYSTTGGTPAESFVKSQLTRYSGGFGVQNSLDPSGSPNHALDNSGVTDGMLLDFGSNLVQLTTLTVGWAAWDSDISVLAYTGDRNSAPDILGNTVGGTTGLLNNGWTLVGNYSNVVANVAQSDNGTSNSTPTAINAGGVSSSWWFVSAYNAAYDNTTSWTQGNDYVKVLAVAGTKTGTYTTPPTGVPEPASLALVAMALVGAGTVRRRAKVASAS